MSAATKPAMACAPPQPVTEPCPFCLRPFPTQRARLEHVQAKHLPNHQPTRTKP